MGLIAYLFYSCQVGHFHTAHHLRDPGNDLRDGDCTRPGIQAFRPAGVDQCRLICGNWSLTVAQVRVMEPALGALLQLMQLDPGAVKVQAVYHHAHVLFAGVQEQLPDLTEIGDTGPCDEFHADRLLISGGQLTQPAELIGIK